METRYKRGRHTDRFPLLQALLSIVLGISLAFYLIIVAVPSANAKKTIQNPLNLETLRGVHARNNGSPLRVWNSQKSPTKATIICVHALGLSSHAYQDFADKLSREGYRVYAIDVRGFGDNRSIDGRSKLDLERTVEDIKRLVTGLKRERENEPIFLVGESMGGAVVLKAASTFPQSLSGALVSAPAFKLYKLKRLTLKGLGDIMLPGRGPAARSVMTQATSSVRLRNHWVEDSANHKLELSLGEATAYYRFVRNTPRYSALINELPVCIMHGLKDHLARPEGSAEIFKQLASRQKTFVIDCEAEHLILEEKQLTKRILATTLRWLNKQLGTNSSAFSSPIMVLNNKGMNRGERTLLNKIINNCGLNKSVIEAAKPASML